MSNEVFPTPAKGLMRRVPGGAMVASTAVITGNVQLGEDCTVWFGAVVRGDDAPIKIGARTNIQDGAVVHCDTGAPQEIGSDCTVGHGAIVHGVKVGNGVLIGMGATILGGAKIGDGCVVAAGALVRQNADIPPNTMVAGVPAKPIREVGDAERAFMVHSIPHYIETGHGYLDESEI
ncbi:MAG TPA: gamma carbonic anhydrase family protein [Planctomycetota bacterium]|jgi:carbonic anhydrase/acetyltransferase-like protein (isoleucine patch superfamily)|nr:gamma carbonic anhydrase family protein [Planctomycetota bacterium]MDP7246355.1 gamma carbonic anhydrase family protein [Planctomycetota bacterium]HJM40153.1 gamma carbonic anhydrase family protein [Planctomycetota bacterium]|tara:strand:+ start:47371 stop:47901 length:531 start_codon:yes stop_codon:yes gene_type:complete